MGRIICVFAYNNIFCLPSFITIYQFDHHLSFDMDILRGFAESLRNNDDQERMQQQDNLLYCLDVLKEGSDGVTPEDMFTVLQESRRLSITGMAGINSKYVAVIINDDDFLDSQGIYSCSIQVSRHHVT